MSSDQQYARLAAHLADPGYALAPDMTVGQIEIERLLATLTHNKVPLIAITADPGRMAADTSRPAGFSRGASGGAIHL